MADVKIVHYMHYNKYWFYWEDELEVKKYYRKGYGDCTGISLLSEEILTERQCREALKALFPEQKIMKALPYHASPSSYGSRPAKITVDRKQMLREKQAFRRELASFEQ